MGTNKSSGSAIIEFALITPFLLLILGGVLACGVALFQISWVSQTAYQAVLMGAELDPSDPESITKMEGRAQNLITVNNLLSPSAAQFVNIELDASYSSSGPEDNRVKLTIEGAINLGMGPFTPIPISIEVTGAMLTRLTGDLSSLDTPANPPQSYDCQGRSGAEYVTPPATGCIQATCSPIDTTCAYV